MPHLNQVQTSTLRTRDKMNLYKHDHDPFHNIVLVELKMSRSITYTYV